MSHNSQIIMKNGQVLARHYQAITFKWGIYQPWECFYAVSFVSLRKKSYCTVEEVILQSNVSIGWISCNCDIFLCKNNSVEDWFYLGRRWQLSSKWHGIQSPSAPGFFKQLTSEGPVMILVILKSCVITSSTLLLLNTFKHLRAPSH